jgi:acetolactate synthase I/II/III large subunit
MSWGLDQQRADTETNDANSSMSLADELVAALASRGISTYFGVPGGAIEPLFNALARHQRAGHVQVIPTRSEAGAAFAADGYFRATGRIAVCTTTTGPGVTNLVTAVMSAYADRIPMLIITPQPPLSRQGRGAFQECLNDPHDFVAMLGVSTRYSAAVSHPAQLQYRLSQALRVAKTPPSGPVHLSIASDLLAQETAPSSYFTRATIPPRNSPSDEGAVAELMSEVLTARRPVFYVGDDAGPDAQRLCQLAAALDGTVVTSPAGKRWISHLDPKYRGVVGFAGHASAHEALRRADLVVTFGATFDEFSTNTWTVFSGMKIFAVDRHATFAYRHPDARIVIAETCQIADRLVSAIPERPLDHRRASTLPPPTLVRSNCDGPVHPIDLMRWLNHGLAPDVVVHVDTGTSMAWATQALVRPLPDTYRVAMGACSMCWAIGAALGAAVAKGERVVCVTGDGAMLMSGLELTVAVEQNLPVTYLVVNNSSLGMVHHGQCLSGAEQIATSIAPVRFDMLAQACGVESMRVESRVELDQVPAAWLRSHQGGPRLVDVRIDPNAVPPIRHRIVALNPAWEAP